MGALGIEQTEALEEFMLRCTLGLCELSQSLGYFLNTSRKYLLADSQESKRGLIILGGTNHDIL
jgi:hypothetical protein